MTDTPNRSTATTARRPDCVTEVRRGNTVLVVSGYFKQGTTATAADKMMKVLEAALLHRAELKHCTECGGQFLPKSNRGKSIT